jgi:hypothetical protein
MESLMNITHAILALTRAMPVAVLCLVAAGPLGAQTSKTPLPQPSPEPDEGNLRAFIELVRSDIKTEKTFIIAQNIHLTTDEAVEFWPLHRDYDLALTKLLDARLELIGDYLDVVDTMTDKQAAALAKSVFDLEEKRVDLKRKWFKKFCKVVPARKAAQFFQIENQINAALDLRLAAALPLIK